MPRVPKSSLAIDHVECVGGRDRYVERMFHHRQHLDKMAPVIDTHGSKGTFSGGRSHTPRPVPRPLSWKREYSPEFSEVRESERRRDRAKSCVRDWIDPSVIELADRLSHNRRLASAKQLHEQEEHVRRQQHMLRRIASYSSLTERKKNQFDWRANPAATGRHNMLMQRSMSSPNTEELIHHALRRRSAHAAHISAVASPTPASRTAARAVAPASARARATERARPPPRPASARVRPQDDGRRTRGVGQVGRGRERPDNEVREHLLRQIVQRRLFREADLRRFFAEVLREDRQTDPVQLEAVVRSVSKEFFL